MQLCLQVCACVCFVRFVCVGEHAALSLILVLFLPIWLSLLQRCFQSERESAQLVLCSLISPFCRDSCSFISVVPIAPLFPLKQRSLLLSPSLLVCFLLPLRASSGALRYLALAPNRSGLVKGFCFFFALYLFRFLRFLCFYLSAFVCECVRVNCCWWQSEAQCEKGTGVGVYVLSYSVLLFFCYLQLDVYFSVSPFPPFP